jgi:hypothetical protein
MYVRYADFASVLLRLNLHPGGRWRCLSHVCSRASLVLDLLDVLDLPGRTAELARTYGIDFFSVINRCGMNG